MKTLTALKREAKKFKWSMVQTNSFFFTDGIPAFLQSYRKVTAVQSDRIAFETVKDGKTTESWATFPKAAQVEITESDNSYFVKFTQDTGTFIKYHLIAA